MTNSELVRNFVVITWFCILFASAWTVILGF